MVADAVIVEPVSTAISLLTGKLTENFAKFGVSRNEFEGLGTRGNPMAWWRKLPTQQNREFYYQNRES